MSNEPKPPTDALREAIARSRPEDYDGHTGFARMNPTERLNWMESAVMLIESRQPVAAKSWGTAEDAPRRSEPSSPS